MQLTYSAITNTPEDKVINQDSYYADDAGLYIIADGIGGYRHSEVASQLIVKVIPDALHKNMLDKTINVRSILQQSIRKAATDLNKLYGRYDSSMSKIATTLTLLFFHNEKYWIAQVGDSRCYIFRHNSLQQITEDHSVAYHQYKNGAIISQSDLKESEINNTELNNYLAYTTYLIDTKK